MSKKYDFKYLVIGSGPAGTAAAIKLAKAKKRVGIVECRSYGGSNLNSRDIPFATALNFTHHFAKNFTYPELRNQEFSFNYPTITAHQDVIIKKSGGNDKKIYEDANVICLNGFANFLDRHTVAIGNKKITSENFILATGSCPKIPDITGLNTVKCLTPEAAIKIRHLPKSIAIVGGGSTGCELAEFFAEIGVKVLLFEMQDRILPREDREVGEVLSEHFTRQLNISVFPACKVVSLAPSPSGTSLIFNYGKAQKKTTVDKVILATGNEPFLNYGLDNAGVKYKNTGIIVDKLFQTSAKNIYAIGDSIGGESSTDLANYQGSTLAGNLINNSKTAINYRGIARLTNTYPEVAVVGYNEVDLAKKHRKCKKSIIQLSEITAGKINNCEKGFVKLLADRTGHLLGATIVSPNANLLIGEIALALRHNLTVLELASTPHITNSLNQAIYLAAKNLIKKK